VGVGGAVLSFRVISQWVFGVNPTAPAFIAGLVVFLLLVAVVATGIPALRATQVHPIRALQAD
jgi:ABC-type antimicrobial peptide transport system permease subunit